MNFNEFKNQIEWAQFGKAFNEKINKDLLSGLPRDALIGRTVAITGAFPMPSPRKLPLITPSALTLGATP